MAASFRSVLSDSDTRGIFTARRGQGSGSANTRPTILLMVRGPPVSNNQDKRSGWGPSPQPDHPSRIISKNQGSTRVPPPTRDWDLGVAGSIKEVCELCFRATAQM